MLYKKKQEQQAVMEREEKQKKFGDAEAKKIPYKTKKKT